MFIRVIISLLLSALSLTAAQAETIIAAFGDSLSAGYQLPPEDGFAPVLQNTLRAQGHSVTVVNAAISGETSSEGLLRVDWMVRQAKPDIVIIEYGANDMLRGLPPTLVYDNLAKIIERLRAADIGILLAGMYAVPNYGVDYQTEFAAVYPRLAEEYEVPLYPFFLDGVATVPELNQPDGLHPTAEGVQVIAERIAPFVVEVLTR